MSAARGRRPSDPRPALTPAVERLIVDLCRRVPELAGLRATDVLVVALGAHGPAVASVRPLESEATGVRIGGRVRRIELGLRPRFFLTGDAPRRLTTLVHELLHLDPQQRGRLLAAHRHAVRPHAEHEKAAREIAARYLKAVAGTAAAAGLLPLAHHGEAWLRTWTERPVVGAVRRAYSDRDVHDAIVMVRTAAPLRASWW